MKPKTKYTGHGITMEELDAVLFPKPPVDVRKLTVEQALVLFQQLKEILK